MLIRLEQLDELQDIWQKENTDLLMLLTDFFLLTSKHFREMGFPPPPPRIIIATTFQAL